MTIFFCALALFNLGLVVILFVGGRSQCFGSFARSALNPVVLFAVFQIIIIVDFAWMYNASNVDFLELRAFVPPEKIVEAYAVHTMIECGAVLGLFLAIAQPVPRPRSARGRVDPAERSAAVILFSLYCIASVFSLIAFLHLQSAEAEGVSYQVIGRKWPWVTAITWIQPMSLALFLGLMRRPVSLLGLGATLVTIAPMVLTSGARTGPILCLMTFMIACSMKWRISIVWYIILIPGLAAYLSVSRYVFREPGFSSFNEFLTANGGILSLFFSSQEISPGKMFSVIYAFADEIPIYPFEGFLAMLAAPIPRALFAMKPYGTSAIFTELYSPERWDLTKSESTISGYGDLYLQFGCVGATIVAFLLGYAFFRICIRLLNDSPTATITWIPIALGAMYTFFRADVFNVGLVLWPTFFVHVTHRALAFMIKSARSWHRQKMAMSADVGGASA